MKSTKKIVMAASLLVLVTGCSKVNFKNIAFGSKSKKESEKVEVIKHEQKLSFGQKAFDVYSKPFSSDETDLVYTTKFGDELYVKNVWQKGKTSSLEVELPGGETGYITRPGRFYGDVNFRYKETINVNGEEINVLSLEYDLPVEYNIGSRIATLRVLPSDDAEIVYTFQNDCHVEAEAITEDYKWIYVKYDTAEGWLDDGFLNRNKGGPVMWTPKLSIEADLFWDGEL